MYFCIFFVFDNFEECSADKLKISIPTSHTHTHIRVKVLKRGPPHYFTLRYTSNPIFFNQAFLSIYDEQLWTVLCNYEPRYKVYVKICTHKQNWEESVTFLKQNIGVYFYWQKVKNGMIGDFVFFGNSRSQGMQL